MSKSSIAIIARYGAIGSAASQFQVVQAPLACWPVRAPLAIASSPVGTVMWNVNDALSRGWSLAGNQVAATCGSPLTIAPSSVGMKPDRPSPPRERLRDAVVAGDDREGRRRSSGRSGLTVSSWPLRCVLALAPLTVSDRRRMPMKSKLKADRFWVARAVMVAMPVSSRSPGRR